MVKRNTSAEKNILEKKSIPPGGELSVDIGIPAVQSPGLEVLFSFFGPFQFHVISP